MGGGGIRLEKCFQSALPGLKKPLNSATKNGAVIGFYLDPIELCRANPRKT